MIKLSILSSLLFSVTLSADIDLTRTRQYFDEAEQYCRKDAGKLWRVSLCSPMLIADPKTRQVTANQADTRGALRKQDTVFTGILPPEVTIANTAVDWSGIHWTMIIWPLPDDAKQRAILIAHELWHRIQNDLGLPMNNPANSHLDSMQGRTWLQLEMRALGKALQSQGEFRKEAVADALLFRAYRQSLFPGSAEEESALEMNEGLAQYTGIAVTSDSPAHDAVNGLASAPEKPSFVRSFAYATGPAYGVLLDQSGLTWRSGLTKKSSLSELLRGAMNIERPQQMEVKVRERSSHYGGEALMRAEMARAEEIEQRLAKFREQFVNGPVLTLPLQEMQVQFDPNTLQSFEPWGTVYPELRLSDKWGILSVTEGALISSDWKRAVVKAPENLNQRPLKGNGWILQLNEGWTIRPGQKAGSFDIVHQGSTTSSM